LIVCSDLNHEHKTTKTKIKVWPKAKGQQSQASGPPTQSHGKTEQQTVVRLCRTNRIRIYDADQESIEESDNLTP